MSTENKPLLLKDLTFSDLIALRDHIHFLVNDSKDGQGISKIDENSIANGQLQPEVEYLDRYIVGKYKKVKLDSMPKKP